MVHGGRFKKLISVQGLLGKITYSLRVNIVNLKKFEINKKVFNSPCVGVVHFEREIFEEIAFFRTISWI